MSQVSFADLHYDALLLSGLLNGMAELHNNGHENEFVACMEIAVRMSRALVDDLETKVSRK